MPTQLRVGERRDFFVRLVAERVVCSLFVYVLFSISGNLLTEVFAPLFEVFVLIVAGGGRRKQAAVTVLGDDKRLLDGRL